MVSSGICILNVLLSALDFFIRLKQFSSGQIYAPRPGFFPPGSRDISLSGDFTTRMSSFFGFISRQPRHCRSGVFFCIVYAWLSGLMSILNPVSLAARRTFCPSFPIASES